MLLNRQPGWETTMQFVVVLINYCYLFCVCVFLQWAYGVTCWEVFTGGKTPYPGISPANIPQKLANGYRLQKPMNNACNDEM